jgi:membrane-associated phospholipid phosphatase/predicted HAD superfamily phosphohydrolase YqeG
VAAVLVAFAALTVVVESGILRGLERPLVVWLWHHHYHNPLNPVADGFALVGHWWFLGPLSLAIAVLLARRGRLWQGVYVVTVMIAEVLLNTGLKVVFQRMPPGTNVVHAATYAYPSGHTMAAASLATALAFVAWDTRWRKAALIAGAAFAVFMGLSRVYLTVHWPSDVLAGWLVGFGLAAWLRLVMDAAFRPAPAAARRAPKPPRRRRIDAVLFDWGDTLMVDDADQLGPMATWPTVVAVAEAQQTLRRLRTHYRLLVATNADESSGPDVRAALARVGMDVYIDGVVSSRDVGARKPDAAFFAAALRQAGVNGKPVAPRHAVMVGDRPDTDVSGAKKAGLRAVWYNPSLTPLPEGATQADAVIARLGELPATLARLAAETEAPAHAKPRKKV